MALDPEQKKVKDASLKGQDAMRDLDKKSLAELQLLYTQAVKDIQQFITSIAAGAGIVAVAALPYLLQQIRARLGNLSAARNALLTDRLQQAAEIGVTPMATRVPAAQLAAIQQEAVQAVREFVGPSDKLRLSDRIWRLDRHAEEIASQSVQNAVVRGQGAMQAAQEFLARRIPLPADIALAKDAARPGNIGMTVQEGLLTGRGAPLDNALRLMRTEINRAHTYAYQKGAAADPAAVGTRFTLSPRHPRVDICDMHAGANLYGLGKGVYPFGKSPLPAHVNTLSFEVIVYKDEVTDADRAGKETVMQFLDGVPAKDRKGILGANKNEAFEAGLLKPNMVKSRWSAVQRAIGRGIGQEGRYQWDEAKREKTLQERALDFADAKLIFQGKTLTRLNTRPEQGERRWVTLGTLDGYVMRVVHTTRGQETRIISMSRAKKYERAIYQERYQQGN